MKAIEMAGGHIALVDDEDFDLVSKYRWHRGDNGYARTTVYVGPDRMKKCLYMHRLIMDAQLGQMLDHKDGRRLDNRRANLRFCSHSENMHNCGPRKGKVPYKGVYKHKLRFHAMIRARGERHFLGSFKTAEEARDAYNAAEREHFGEFSKAG